MSNRVSWIWLCRNATASRFRRRASSASARVARVGRELAGRREGPDDRLRVGAGLLPEPRDRVVQALGLEVHDPEVHARHRRGQPLHRARGGRDRRPAALDPLDAVAAHREDVLAVVVPEEDPGRLLGVEARLHAARCGRGGGSRTPGRRAGDAAAASKATPTASPIASRPERPRRPSALSRRIDGRGGGPRAGTDAAIGVTTGVGTTTGVAGRWTPRRARRPAGSPWPRRSRGRHRRLAARSRRAPGAAGRPGAAGTAGGATPAWPGLGHDLRRQEHHQLAPLRLGQIVLEQPAEDRDLREPGNPALVVVEPLLAEARDHDRAAVDDLGLGDRVAGCSRPGRRGRRR